MSTKKETRNPVFQMRIEPELKARFVAEAERRGLPLASWMKMLAMDELNRIEQEKK